MTNRLTQFLNGSAPSLTAGLLLAVFSLTASPGHVQAQPPATTPAERATEQSAKPAGIVTARFFDVGQGDATLLTGPDFAILIDAGRHDRDDVVPLLKKAGIEKIDLLIGTHAHADHIGQFPQVLAAFPVAEVWLSGDEHTSRTFERAIDAILDSDADFHEPRAGEKVRIGSARVEVLNPKTLTDDLHKNCIGVRIAFGYVAFVFTGDIEHDIETKILERGHEVGAQILQLGHHGSRTSSSLAFLRAVDPEIAIYSAEKDSRYGHPHDEVVERVANLGIKLYGTPKHGTIRVFTNGATYKVMTERNRPARGPPTEPTEDGCPEGKVDINTASVEELMQIIHIGRGRAAQLIRLRPFRSVDGLRRINGIGAGRLRDIKSQGLACVPQ
ncbi:MAG: MBL fold metallo-hydrolase [Candidatus Paceibacterota bacterium]